MGSESNYSVWRKLPVAAIVVLTIVSASVTAQGEPSSLVCAKSYTCPNVVEVRSGVLKIS